MKRATKACLSATALAGLLFAGISAHAENSYYRWQDAQGNPVHSDRPPPLGTPYEVITSGSSLVRKVAADEGAVPATTEPTVRNDFEPVEAKVKPVTKNAEQCKRARENLATLDTKVRIQIRNDQGELRPLSEEEKEIQRKQAIDTIAVHCD